MKQELRPIIKSLIFVIEKYGEMENVEGLESLKKDYVDRSNREAIILSDKINEQLTKIKKSWNRRLLNSLPDQSGGLLQH